MYTPLAETDSRNSVQTEHVYGISRDIEVHFKGTVLIILFDMLLRIMINIS